MTDERRFHAGWRATLDGLPFRVRIGPLPDRPDHHVLEWQVRPDLDDPTAWRAITARTIGTIVECVYEIDRVEFADKANELPVRPGEYFLRFLRRCTEVGAAQADREWREKRTATQQNIAADRAFIEAIKRATP